MIMHPDIWLNTPLARQLYHEVAKTAPIVDYHNHLSPGEYAANLPFENLSQLWLTHDHYKWRAMRLNGINETYITGSASAYEKFQAWAATLTKLWGSPLAHWSHLELYRCFGICSQLTADTAPRIWQQVQDHLQQTKLSPQSWLQQCRVQTFCTTDDPIDNLHFHRQTQLLATPSLMLPTYRPDVAFAIDQPVSWNRWLDALGQQVGSTLNTLDDLWLCLDRRHLDFHQLGCRLSDHGLARCWVGEYRDEEIAEAFAQARRGLTIDEPRMFGFRSWLLERLAELNYRRNWTQQLHLGAWRNVNTTLFQTSGADRGGDAMGEAGQAQWLGQYFDQLLCRGQLPQCVVYNNHPADNYPIATLLGSFADGRRPTPIQWGPAWWHLDHRSGIREQLDITAQVGLLGRAIGMTTDSRSWLSLVRHDYYRRILCDWVAEQVHLELMPADHDRLHDLIADLCWRNAANYLKIGKPEIVTPES